MTPQLLWERRPWAYLIPFPRQRPKIAFFSNPSYFSPTFMEFLLELCNTEWAPTTRRMGLPGWEQCWRYFKAVSIQYTIVTDGQTDASWWLLRRWRMASRGKHSEFRARNLATDFFLVNRIYIQNSVDSGLMLRLMLCVRYEVVHLNLLLLTNIAKRGMLLPPSSVSSSFRNRIC